MALNDTYFFTAQGALGGRAYVHTLHFRECAGAAGPDLQQDLIDKWQLAAQTQWMAIHPSSYTLQRLTAQRICGTLPLPSRTEEGSSAVGTRTISGEQLPPWLAVAVNESSALAGRTRHGRFFVSGGGETDVNGETLLTSAGTWLPAINAYVTALTAAFITPSPPVNWQLVVHSRKLADVPGTQCQDSSVPVTRLGVNARLTTQRSRRA